MSADENYRRRLNSGESVQAAALLAIADGVDELIAMLRPLVDALATATRTEADL